MKRYLFCVAVLMAGTASAQTGSPSAAPNGAGARGSDPNEMICRSIAEMGTRLNRQRICKTRAEWAEERRQQRQQIDQNQTNRRGPDNS